MGEEVGLSEGVTLITELTFLEEVISFLAILTTSKNKNPNQRHAKIEDLERMRPQSQLANQLLPKSAII